MEIYEGLCGKEAMLIKLPKVALVVPDGSRYKLIVSHDSSPATCLMPSGRKVEWFTAESQHDIFWGTFDECVREAELFCQA